MSNATVTFGKVQVPGSNGVAGGTSIAEDEVLVEFTVRPNMTGCFALDVRLYS